MQFRHTGGIAEHASVHDPSRRFACPHCPKSYKTRAELSRHKKNHNVDETSMTSQVAPCAGVLRAYSQGTYMFQAAGASQYAVHLAPVAVPHAREVVSQSVVPPPTSFPVEQSVPVSSVSMATSIPSVAASSYAGTSAPTYLPSPTPTMPIQPPLNPGTLPDMPAYGDITL
jgi:hypothetical protein